MYFVTITFPCGPTIMEGDTEPVIIRRAEHSPERVNELQKAALVLGASDVKISKEDN